MMIPQVRKEVRDDQSLGPEANLITAIVRSWSVKLTFIDNLDNKPVGFGVKKNDITLIAGTSRKF
jgi:hypothetical protein